jgi:hypothetical protein
MMARCNDDVVMGIMNGKQALDFSSGAGSHLVLLSGSRHD